MLCVGAGGLGSPAALYLAAAGIGTLGVIDWTPSTSNLQRQILARRRRPLEAGVRSRPPDRHQPRGPRRNLRDAADVCNAIELFRDYDVILDGTDNFATRYLVNDACVLLKKANAYGSIFRFEGQASVFATVGGPCYRCLYPGRRRQGW